ncbi:MAG: protein kinase [Polyangiales bacterium]
MERQPEHVGPYQLVRPLGAGGMAETFLAVRRGPAGFEQKVCLKRILPGRAADPVFVELFLDEARLLARLQCQSITHVLDFGEADGCYYMALELVDGVDLDGLLVSLRERGLRMPQEVALYIVSELLSALSYAHGLVIDGVPQHIVHRDISPSNILISKQGEVKLTDFGIAKAAGRTHRTVAGQTKGKIAYMSPEQVRAEELDGRSDLFALGVVLFELLTGTHPFDATTDFALQVNIMSGKRHALRELLPNADPRVAALLDALLAPNRDDRPASADAAHAMLPPLTATFSLQRALQQLLGAEPERGGAYAAPATTGASRQQVFARPTTAAEPGGAKRKLLPALIAAAILLGGGLAYALAAPRIAAWRAERAEPAITPELPKVPSPPPTTTTTTTATGTAAPPSGIEPPTGVEPPTDVRTQGPATHAGTSHEAPTPPEAPEANTPAETKPTRTHAPQPGRSARHEPHEQPIPSDDRGTAAEAPHVGAPTTPSATPARGPLTPPIAPPSRVVIKAPTGNEKDEEERKRNAAGGTYVAPNGRVVTRAPPPQ